MVKRTPETKLVFQKNKNKKHTIKQTQKGNKTFNFFTLKESESEHEREIPDQNLKIAIFHGRILEDVGLWRLRL